MDSLPDYYAALHVGPAATQREISRAYRALMRTHHPDVDGGNVADRRVQDNELLGIMQAFAVLRDPVRRAAYDRTIRGQGGRGQRTAEQRTAERGTAEQRPAEKRTAEQGAAGQGSRSEASAGQRFTVQNAGDAAPQNIPVRKVKSRAEPSRHTIRITPVRWESGPWA